MKKIIKFPFKIIKESVPTSAVIELFPENYTELNYLEPFGAISNIILNKQPSIEETINDTRSNMINIMRTIRDNVNGLSKSLNKIKYSEKVFNNFLLETSSENNDITNCVRDFSLRCMSRGNNAKNYIEHPINEWNNNIESLDSINQRLKNVFLISRCPIHVIKAFNSDNTFCYCNTLADDDIIDEVFLDKLSKIVMGYSGKLLILGTYTPMYKRMFKGWKSHKKDKYCLWSNY